jgi:2-keto-4-pentenoate hydratase/2-oxohepta-3-ene-1,7-dioic acid hydratase in catechol pathway
MGFPIGPMLVSTDLVGDPAALRIVTSVNGEERQNDVVASLVFDVPTLIGYLSQITTLVTGDVIFTGTPAGVGASQGKSLADGDVITTTIDRLGTLVNRCRRVSGHTGLGRQAEATA